ncbi:MAG: 2,3,4,5-tetrahydropyridine-2,6-dicarboxylate N-succinyltransferase [Gemmatimonadota bacterium]|nr:2,3,4,5-tetrahydropyridine-2,6-dicarboxylate N-succinyltransferase [Gemmatimonadota bacterium]
MSTSSIGDVERRVEALAATASGSPLPGDARAVVEQLLDALERGTVRAAEKEAATGQWRAVPWVKRGILLGFRVGAIVDMSIRTDEQIGFSFFDKDTYPPRRLSLSDGIRIVPGGSSIRRGAFVASGVVCMPPMYINVGAHVGTGTMIDSHALVGSCAQVGERVHLSAAAQLGGVLEPVNAAPVVVEDDVVVGGNCGIFEGTVVRKRAVIGAGVVLTRGTPVYDLERETVHRAESGRGLVIPENAVVVPGARRVSSKWAQDQGISLQTPVIVKYRDEKTDAATALESWLR